MTWKRDSHGLFDQESRSIQCHSFAINRETWLYTKEGKFREHSNYEPNEVNKTKYFGKFIKDLGNNIYFYGLDHFARMEPNVLKLRMNEIETEKLSENQNDLEYMYWVIRSFGKETGGGYKLQIGDLLKLGRVKFFVREFCFKGKRQLCDSNILFMRDTVNSQLAKQLLDSSIVDSEMKAEVTCRVCLSEMFSEKNPLVSCCSCKGSVEYIHLDCLKMWLHSKLFIRDGVYSKVFNQKNFECEICNTPYPKTLKQLNHEGVNHNEELLHQEQPTEDNQIVLETLNKENNLTGALHIVQLREEGNVVKIGRGSESDIRISDISVSRCHTYIRMDTDGFQVDDNNSKFGTLVRVPEGICLEDCRGLEGHAIQMGRTLLSVSYNKGFNFAKMLTQLQKQSNNEPKEKDNEKMEIEEESK